MVELPDSWSVEEKISHLQRRILVYSYQYYEIGDTVVDDSFYDSCVKQLLMLKDEYPEEYKRSLYYYAYKDFTGGDWLLFILSLTNKTRENNKSNRLFVCRFV